MEVDFKNHEHILTLILRVNSTDVKNLINTMVLQTDLGKKQSAYRVTLNPDEIYCLGPFTRVLSAVSEDTFVIVVETSNKEEVLRTIHSKGQNKFNLYQASAKVLKKR